MSRLDGVILIFGTRAYFEELTMLRFVCSYCRVNAPQRVYRRVNRFSIFFIPLFTVSRRHFVECSNCGGATALTEQQAHHALQWAAGRR